MLRTSLCDLVGIRHPVVLAGMAGGNTSPELVAAVSNAGGLGVFGASWLTSTDIRGHAARIRELTSAPFGLNLLLFAHDDDRLDAVLAERPPVVSFAWPASDQPLASIFARAHDAGAKVMHMVPSVREALWAAEAGADIIVAQGTEGGGHVGVMGAIALVPQVVDAVPDRPVLAAGGIADGRGLAAALALGAAGVLVGTRFLATYESPLHSNFKQAILTSDGHDTDLTVLPDVLSGRIWPGALARVWRNAFIREWAGCEWELRQRRPQILAETRAAREAGDADRTVLWFGQDAGLIRSIEPAAEVVARMVQEAHEIVTGRLAHMAGPGAPSGTLAPGSGS